MFALVYSSQAAEPFDETALIALADHAAEKNRRLAITGYLNYRNGAFFQYLEGARASVLELMQTIAADERHQVSNIIHLDEMRARRFANWSMRYVTPREVASIQLEEVLESVLNTMRGQHFDLSAAQDTVLRLVGKIAEGRGRLSHASK